jgi:predicted alpha/beta-fold hydrolase
LNSAPVAMVAERGAPRQGRLCGRAQLRSSGAVQRGAGLVIRDRPPGGVYSAASMSTPAPAANGQSSRDSAAPALSYPPFRARAPWWGGDLQTLRNSFVGPRLTLSRWPEQTVELDLNDGSGDRLLGQLQLPSAPDAVPRTCIVLVHGLGGDETSSYLQASAQFWLERNHPVLRLNQRGAGPSREICRFQYHAGKSEDLHAGLASFCDQQPSLAAQGLAVVGFSLGGNVALKFASEGPGALPVRAVASVSAPIDLALASRRLHERRNYLYLRYLLHRLRRDTLGPGAQLTPDEREVARTARTILEFDDRFIAPRGGFSGAQDYYAKCSAGPRLSAIELPTLAIHAMDDPWIPAEMYFEASSSAPVEPRAGCQVLLPPSGGHVGFHSAEPAPTSAPGESTACWHDRSIAIFFERVFA